MSARRDPQHDKTMIQRFIGQAMLGPCPNAPKNGIDMQDTLQTRAQKALEAIEQHGAEHHDRCEELLETSGATHETVSLLERLATVNTVRSTAAGVSRDAASQLEQLLEEVETAIEAA